MSYQRKKWFTVSVKADFGWPTKRIELFYKGHKYLIRPETDDLEPTVSVHYDIELEFKEGENLINRFLSVLAWSENYGVHVLSGVTSSTEEPIRIGKSNSRFVSQPYEYIYLPKPEDSKSLRALAIYREAMSVNSFPYKFLGFFKILNIQFSTGNEQKKWINDNINNITDYQGIERYKILKKEINNVGEYLYHQGRCAVAHAFSENVVDPDIAEESKRLENDTCLIKALAQLMISKEFKVKTTSEFIEDIHWLQDLPSEYIKIDLA